MRIPATSAARGILVLSLALVLAALLDAEGLRKQAQIQPQGFQRRVALDLTKPLVRVSRALHLTTPRHELQVAIGREHEDDIDTGVHLTLPPPAGPLPNLRPGVRPHKPGPPPRPVFTRAHPLHVWVAGDSLAQVPGDGVERVAPDSLDVVAVESRLSTGLARPDLYNWYTRFKQVITTMKPQVVVLSFGADDAHDYMAGVPGGRSVGAFGTPSWIAEYRRRVDGVTREFNAAGIRTVWLGLPIPDGPGFRHSFPVVNVILASVAKRHARLSQYVDTWHLLDSAHGKYTPYLRVGGQLTLMRLPDGVHYTAAAGDLIARNVLDQLRRSYDLR
jgi:lysophospholipase L1-like esterase